MAFTRVQATAKSYQATAASIAFSFSTAPTVGNGLVVFADQYRSAGQTAVPSTCTDNYGNTYLRAAVQEFAPGPATTAIFYCAKVVATGSPFTLTVSNAPTYATSAYWVASATEISGVGGGLTIDQIAAGANGISTLTPATGATPALTGSEVLLAAIFAVAAAQTAITVQSDTPPWTHEFQELPYNYIAGEADSRIVTGAVGTTPGCSWTVTAGAYWAAVLVAFKASAAPPGVTGATLASTAQLYPPGVAAVSLQAVTGATVAATSTLFPPAVAFPASVAVTQLVDELLDVELLSPAAVTQLLSEVLDTPGLGPLALTQLLCEIISVPIIYVLQLPTIPSTSVVGVSGTGSPGAPGRVDAPDDAAITCGTPFPIDPDE